MRAYSFVNPSQTNRNGRANPPGIDYLSFSSINDSANHETEYMKYINLGLKYREKADLELTTDLASITTTINGEKMTYNYDGTDSLYTNSGNNYKLDLYESDYNYRAENYYSNDIKEYKTSTDLNIQMTYRLTLTNKSDPNINIKANEITVYYDKRLKPYGSTYTIAEKNETTGLLENKTYNAVQCNNAISTTSKYSGNSGAAVIDNNYNVLYITSNDYIYPSENTPQTIDITFTVDKSNGANNLGTHSVVAEIGAYTTQYVTVGGEEPKYAGLVDIDSNPSNLNLNREIDGKTKLQNYDDYEDDSCKTEVTLKVPTGNEKLQRTVSGNVWEDLNKDGTKDNTDKNIEKIKVSMVEIVPYMNDGKLVYYEKVAKDTVSTEDGNYTLADFVPGYYITRFDYGYDLSNVTYNGQDYKSTIYYNAGYYKDKYTANNDNIGVAANYEYFDKVKNSLKVENKSDALDDEIRRLNVNSYSETMTSAEAKLFKDNNDGETISKFTQMFADSTLFYAKPEEVASNIKTINAIQNDFNTNRKWILSNLDFGLQMRPLAELDLDKEVKTVSIKTSSGKNLVKLNFKKDDTGVMQIDETNSVGYNNVEYMPKSAVSKGFIYINMDTEILVGATVEVEYEMEVTNKSETDYVGKDIYSARFENLKTSGKRVYFGDNYSVNNSFAEDLAEEYYEEYSQNEVGGKITDIKENYKYLKKLKKPCDNNTEYYGRYLGQYYYTGTPNATYDVASEIKVNKILDLLDNDFTFSQNANSAKNRMWKTTTSEELKNGILDFESISKLGNNVGFNVDNYLLFKDNSDGLIDNYQVKYDTGNRSNLLLSVDTNRNGSNVAKGNESLSKFLKNTGSADVTTGKITLVASKILTTEDVHKGTALAYDNAAEIVEYTNLTGRKTKTGVVGNMNKNEVDSSQTPTIIISPPTGLTK